MTSVRIGDLVEAVESLSPEGTGIGHNDRFVYVDLSAVDNEKKEITGARRVLRADAPSRARQLIQAGDLLMSTVRPNLNAVATVPVQLDGAIASTGFCVLRPRHNVVCGRYLFHWLTTPQFVAEMVQRATGQSYPAVSDAIIKDPTCLYQNSQSSGGSRRFWIRPKHCGPSVARPSPTSIR